MITTASGDQGLYTWYYKCPQCSDIDIVFDMSIYGIKWDGLSYDSETLNMCDDLEIFCEQCTFWHIINFKKRRILDLKTVPDDIKEFKKTLKFGIDKVFVCDNVNSRPDSP
jgi:hypothetical protein